MVAKERFIVNGMPEHASRYDGPIDFIGSIEEIAAEIARRVGSRGACSSGVIALGVD